VVNGKKENRKLDTLDYWRYYFGAALFLQRLNV